MPSNFDCDLGFALGHAAAALVAAGETGYLQPRPEPEPQPYL